MRITYYYYYSDCFPLWVGTLYTITATIVIVFGISPPVVGCKYKIVPHTAVYYSEHGLEVRFEKRQRGSDLKPSTACTR